MIVSSISSLVRRQVLKIWVAGTWSRRVELRTYWVVGSSWMVWMWVGMGMFRAASWMAMGVRGLIISASSWVRPPEFWRLARPFWMIFSTSYLAIRQRSSVPVIVTIFLFLLEYSSLLRQTKAPVLALIPLMVSPPFPIINPISLTGISSQILCEPLIAPLFIFLCVSTMKFSSFLTLSTDSGSPQTKMLRVLAPGALEVATWTFRAPDFLAMFLMVSPYLPITRPTHSLGTSRMKAFSEGGPQGVVKDRLKSPSFSPIPCCWLQDPSCSCLIRPKASSSEKIILSISAQALATCASPSPSTNTCRSSSSSQSPVWFCEPFPLTSILHPVFSSSCFWLLPLGPMSRPVQLKLLSLGRTILRLILEASFIIENTPVFNPIGKLLLPSTRVMPMVRFLLAGLSFFMSDSPLTQSLVPYKLWCNLDLSSPALSMVTESSGRSAGLSENLLFFFQEQSIRRVPLTGATYFCCGGGRGIAYGLFLSCGPESDRVANVILNGLSYPLLLQRCDYGMYKVVYFQKERKRQINSHSDQAMTIMVYLAFY